jgi:hypothetical protein
MHKTLSSHVPHATDTWRTATRAKPRAPRAAVPRSSREHHRLDAGNAGGARGEGADEGQDRSDGDADGDAHGGTDSDRVVCRRRG